ncbi:MAG: hypothetical protein M1540_05565 [Candidatus Bathyarchaeota archaeon]|nr:hypothetical protein [Candidatus Bathyarchaeota archaeon]
MLKTTRPLSRYLPSPYITVDQKIYLGRCRGPLLFHLLPAAYAGDCILGSAGFGDCRLVVEQTATRTNKTDAF